MMTAADTSETTMSEALTRISRKVIRQAISELSSPDTEMREHAKSYINSDQFLTHQQRAGYPDELHDSLKYLMLRSRAERYFLGKEVVALLKEVWGD